MHDEESQHCRFLMHLLAWSVKVGGGWCVPRVPGQGFVVEMLPLPGRRGVRGVDAVIFRVISLKGAELETSFKNFPGVCFYKWKVSRQIK